MYKYLFTLIVIIGLASCKVTQSTEEKPTKEEVFWVNSYKVPCEGITKTMCLNIQRKDSLDLDGKWETFYNQIEGFNYQSGKIYKIAVTIDSLSNPPADASSLNYKLAEIIDTKTDPRSSLHGTWKITKIGDSINTSQVVPTIEINTRTEEIAGNDGCNQFGGSIHKLNENELDFGPLMQTKMMCPDMTIPNAFTLAIKEVKYYTQSEHLILLDKDKKPLLELMNID